MQTTTQETQALNAVANQAARDKRTRCIFLICFLEAERSAAILGQQWSRMLSRNIKPSALQDAIFEGHIALVAETNRCASELTIRGQLLFAFPETTVLQGCAA